MSDLDVEHAPDSREPVQDVRDVPEIGLPDMDLPDIELQDAELQQEIELVSDLVVAASASDAPLSRAEIDRALGLRP